jgi:hypothetical protein
MLSYAHRYAVFWGYGGGGCLIYSKCHTRYSRSILRTVWSCFIVAKRFVSYVLYVSVELSAVFFLDWVYLLSIVDSLVVLIMWYQVL